MIHSFALIDGTSVEGYRSHWQIGFIEVKDGIFSVANG
jgi:hypothetical protein